MSPRHTVPPASPADPPAPLVRADDEMAGWDVVATATAIRDRQVRAEEVLEAAIARAEALGPTLGALATTAFDEARAALARRQVPTARPALHGVPTAIKDLDELRGIRTTFGSRASGHHVSRRTGRAVRQHLATGLVAIGKSAAPEYGMTPTAETPGFAPTRNPWDPDRTVGGSSSGAAALVAAGIVPIAHGSDGGGSIRIPAACAGLVGLKPTQGRLLEPEEMRGLPVKVATAGVLTRTVGDTAAFMAAAERVWANPALPPLGHVDAPDQTRRRVGVVLDSPLGPVDPQVRAATRRAADDLAALGHHVEEVDSPVPGSFGEDFLRYWAVLAAGLGPLGLVVVGPRFAPWRLDRWTRGLARHAAANAARLPGTVARLRRLRHDVEEASAGYDVLLTPTLGLLPPPLGWLSVDLPFDEHRGRVESFVPFTPAWNVTGAPAISLPVAVSAEGLPIGVQLGAAFGEDGVLLAMAHELAEGPGFQRPLRAP